MLTQRELIEWYLRNRRRTTAFFDMLSADAYFRQPIPLRNPLAFYEGHLPAFSANTLLKKGLGQGAIDPRLDLLFARGIDPVDEASAQPRVKGRWPAREEVLDYGYRVDAAVVEALGSAEFEAGQNRLLEMAYTIIEHEAMHQETLLYLWHELDYRDKSRPPPNGLLRRPQASEPVLSPAGRPCEANGRVRIPAGEASLGMAPGSMPFGWDNEFPSYRVSVPAFEIDAFNVSNGEFMAFVEAGAYREKKWWSPEGWAWLRAKSIAWPHFWFRRGDVWAWRGMFELIDLPLDWPVYVSQVEAAAYARWKEARLPSEAEYHRAAFGTPDGDERPYPWGDALPGAGHGNFDFSHWEPVPIGSYADGRSAWGIYDLIGNGWEWTSTLFAGHPGFTPMDAYPEYSADFFDDLHYVLKGASPATARELVRPAFRNWFRATYPYVYATFRTAVTSEGSGH